MIRYFFFDDGKSVRFLCATSSNLSMVLLRAELGSLQRIDNSVDMDATELADNIAMALQHGFVELSETEFFEKQKSMELEVQRRCEDGHDPQATIIDWEQLADQYGRYFINSPSEYLSAPLRKFCVFAQPVLKSSDLTMGFDPLAATAQTEKRNLIFTAGLHIDGNLDAASFTSELPLFVLVLGDLHCHNLLLNCWAELVVTGNLYVSGVIMGYDGETGGRLKVHGDAHAHQILSGCMYAIEVSGEIKADSYWLQPDESTIADAEPIPAELTLPDWVDRESRTPLVDEVYHAETNWSGSESAVTYQFNFEFARDLVRRGHKLFR